MKLFNLTLKINSQSLKHQRTRPTKEVDYLESFQTGFRLGNEIETTLIVLVNKL